MKQEEDLLKDIDFEPWQTDDIAGSMDYLLDMFSKVRAERTKQIMEFENAISVAQHAMAQAATPYDEVEKQLQDAIWHCLEMIEGEKHESEIGKAQIIRPKARISYDVKGLENVKIQQGWQ